MEDLLPRQHGGEPRHHVGPRPDLAPVEGDDAGARAPRAASEQLLERREQQLVIVAVGVLGAQAVEIKQRQARPALGVIGEELESLDLTISPSLSLTFFLLAHSCLRLK